MQAYQYMQPYTVREKRERKAAEQAAKLRKAQRFYRGILIAASIGAVVGFYLNFRSF